MTLNHWPSWRKMFLYHHKARLAESSSSHPNGGSYWFLSITNVILIQNDLQWCMCICNHTLEPGPKWNTHLEEEGSSSGIKQILHKLWLGTITQNEKELGDFTGK